MTTSKKPQRPRARTREELMAECDEIQALALTCVRVYPGKDGKMRQVEQPDFRAALMCVDLKAKLLGLLGDGRQMDRTQLEAELDRLGYRLVPKLKEVK